MASRRGTPNMTPEQERMFLQIVAVGAYPAEAARNVGLTPQSVYMRRKRDKRFAELLAQAEAKAEIALILHVQKAAPKDWRAAMTLLERRFKERWAKPDPKGGDVSINAAVTVRPEVAAIELWKEASATVPGLRPVQIPSLPPPPPEPVAVAEQEQPVEGVA